MSWIQVMVASSDPEGRVTLAKILAECGLTPLIATSVEEVRSVLSRSVVHLMFCEDNLPDGRYSEVLHLARSTSPIPQVVVCSRLGELEEYLEAAYLGAFDFILPPYRSAEIVSVLYGVWKDYCAKGEENALLYSGRSIAAGRQVNSSRA